MQNPDDVKTHINEPLVKNNKITESNNTKFLQTEKELTLT